MSTTTGLYEHTPIIAYGKVQNFTNAASAEGSRTITFTNSGGNAIVVGDHVFTSLSGGTQVQYHGVCTLVTSTTSIATQYATQNVMAGNNDYVWVPTAAVDFQYQVAPGSQQDTVHLGTELFISKGNVAYPVQSADAYETFALSFNPAHPADFEELKTFLVTTRTKGTKTFSLAFWHASRQLSTTYEVYAYPSTLSVTHVGPQIASFSLQFFVVTADTYVAS